MEANFFLLCHGALDGTLALLLSYLSSPKRKQKFSRELRKIEEQRSIINKDLTLGL